MQSWSCDLASPRGDLNVSQTMNTWSEMSRRVKISGTVPHVPPPSKDVKHTANIHLPINFVSK